MLSCLGPRFLRSRGAIRGTTSRLLRGPGGLFGFDVAAANKGDLLELLKHDCKGNGIPAHPINGAAMLIATDGIGLVFRG